MEKGGVQIIRLITVAHTKTNFLDSVLKSTVSGGIAKATKIMTKIY